ncbi:MAG: hypothetical protein A2Y54_03310 [Chloroflexi bacterium RBG_16_51_16]|nr:MAG: hypothetical protein A2Y54_03310 [Chloroflexi bacterium RBG_16_51_16]
MDPETPLSCIGSGALGGKASGLAFIRNVLGKLELGKYPGIRIEIPSLVVICTDVFDAFMERNHLMETALSEVPDDRLAHAFQKADLPFEILGDLRALIDDVHMPLVIRSSSLLEDSRREPFAGIYATKMIPNNRFDPDSRFNQLVEAIKLVYASTYFRSARDYRKALGHGDEDEKMALIIQEVVGKRYQNRFYPELSGVMRSYNYYPMEPAAPEEGVVNLALGLGKTIVDGGINWPYSPAYPKVEPPFGSVEKLLKNTQSQFWAVNMGEPPEYDPVRETEYLLLEDITAAEEDNSLTYLVSTYSPLSGRLSIGTGFKGPRALTFAPLLVLNQLPFNDLIQDLLNICTQALGTPVEIEFAMNFNPHRFGFLQVRSMIVPTDDTRVSADELVGTGVLVGCDHVLGNGMVDDIVDVVYVKPDSFDLKHTLSIAPELELFNKKFLALGRSYLLIVLGRLGTTDPWLGIPIIWSRISAASVVVEATRENVRVELSQGSHYFHNIINLGIKYFTLPFTSRYKVDWDWLNRQEIVEETAFIRHIKTPRPLRIKVDGRNSRGVILK